MTVYTGNIRGAGTDSDISIVLFGDKSISPPIKLKSGLLRNCFEKGAVDVFDVNACDVGVLQRICIAHDNSGIGPGTMTSLSPLL